MKDPIYYYIIAVLVGASWPVILYVIDTTYEEWRTIWRRSLIREGLRYVDGVIHIHIVTILLTKHVARYDYYSWQNIRRLQKKYLLTDWQVYRLYKHNKNSFPK